MTFCRILTALLLLSHAAFADELSDAFDSLKAAMETKNAAEVKKWANETSRLARAEAAKPQPADADPDYWKQRMVYATQTDVFTEYALGAIAITPGVSSKDIVMLVDGLIEQNRKSTYLEMTAGTYLNAVRTLGDHEDQVREAAKMLVLAPESEDALLILAEGHFTSNRMPEATEYAARLIRTLTDKPKPAGGTEAEWQSKKEILLGRGYYIAGVSACMSELWADCDKDLRTAEPLLTAQANVQGPLYFYMGLAKYRLSQPTKNKAMLQEAIAYSKRSTTIAGPMQASAKQNVAVMERALPTFK